MTRVALIACDHGLGHVRRMMLIGEALAAAGAEVTLLAPPEAVARVRRSLAPASGEAPDLPGRVQAFSTRTTPAALRAGDPEATAWERRLPDLSGYDRVVCDTLPEVLAVRPDAVLVAQFLWHDVLEGVDAGFGTRAATLAASARLVTGSVAFAMPAVRGLPGFTEVGLFVRPGTRPLATAGRDLLISGGTTPAVAAPLRALVDRLASAGPGPYATVHVDAELLDATPSARTPGWMRAATHDAAMYDALRGALVRPGLGVVTELVARGIPMWTVREAGNTELAHNATVLVERGLGVDLGVIGVDPTAARAAAPASMADAVLAGPGDVRPAALPSDGAAAVARLVLA